MKITPAWSDKVVQDSGASHTIYDVIYTLDGSKVIAAANSEILIYDALEGGLIKALKAHKEPVFCLAPLLDNGFASGGGDKQVIIWSSTFQGLLKYSHNDGIQSLCQNPVTGILLSCTHSEFGLWTRDVKALPKTKVNSRIVSCSWSIDGQMFALGLFNGTVSIRSSSGEEKARIDRGSSPIWSLAWSPAVGLDTNVLAVSDWSQKLAFFDSAGKQIGKDRVLGFDPCSISYLNGGEYLLIGGSDKQVHLWTADGIKIGKICDREGWVWSCKAMNQQPYIAVGSADGTVSSFQIIFNTVHGMHNDRYAFRQNMTDIIIQHMSTNQKAKIRCRDYIKKISVFKDILAVQLPGRICIYELYHDEQGSMHYRIKEKFVRKADCALMVATASSVLFCNDKKIERYAFSGEILQDWNFDAIVRYIKVIGGPNGKEGLLVGLKNGAVMKLFVDNPFPLLLIEQNFQIKCVDISLNQKTLAVVDDGNTCSVYNLSSKTLLYQEPDVQSVSFNSEVDEAICFSGMNGLIVKIDKFMAYQQKLRGLVVGYKGACVYYLDNNVMRTVNVPQTVPMEGCIERSDFESAYRIASYGVPDNEWRRLAMSAMEQISLDVAKKAFSRIRDFKFLEAIRVIEKMKQDGRRETDLFQAEVSAYCENYAEAARLFKKSGNIQKAIEMYTELNMWERATVLAEEIHEDTHGILTKKAQMQHDRKEVLEAASTYEQIGDYSKAIDLLGNGGYVEKLIDVVHKLKSSDRELLLTCIDFFKKEKNSNYALETLQKLNDTSLILAYHVDLQQWEIAFQIAEDRPEFAEQIYLPYGHWLALNDRFDEAQTFYTKAGRPDEAIRILRFLAESAVIQQRYRLAAYYYWSLSKSSIATFQKRSNISQKEEKSKPLEAWKVNHELSELYYAYAHIFQYVEDPFTVSLPAALLNCAKFLVQKLYERQAPPGISKSYIYYCFAKISSQLGCFKTSKYAYEKLSSMRLPSQWQETVEISSMLIKSKTNEDSKDYEMVCGQCNFRNVPFSVKNTACVNCIEPFVLSFYSFDNLPLVRFEPAPTLSDIEVEKLIKNDPPETSNNEFSKLLETWDRSGNDTYKPIEFSRQQLLALDPHKVYIRKWGSLVPKEYYLLNSSDTFVVLCSSCQHFFVEDEWNYQVLLTGQCPFCKFKVTL